MLVSSLGVMTTAAAVAVSQVADLPQQRLEDHVSPNLQLEQLEVHLQVLQSLVTWWTISWMTWRCCTLVSGRKCSRPFVPLNRGSEKVNHHKAQDPWIVIQSLQPLQGFQQTLQLKFHVWNQLSLTLEQLNQWKLQLWLHQVAGLQEAKLKAWMAAGICYQTSPLKKLWRWRIELTFHVLA